MSYPKAGRTWVANIYLNYWHLKQNKNEEALPFTTNFSDQKFKDFNRQSHLYFTHGGKMSDLRKSRLIINPMVLANLNLTLLVRNPISCLVSYYYHDTYNLPEQEKPSIESFIDGDRGYKSMAQYHNQVFAHIKDNPKHLVVTYESIHPKTAGHMETMAKMISHSLGELDQEALEAAVKACEFNTVKSKITQPTKRIRQGSVGAQDQALSEDKMNQIHAMFMDELHGDAKLFYEKHYPLAGL